MVEGLVPKVMVLPAPGAIALRGAFVDLGPAVAEATACALPETRQITGAAEVRLGWMSPDELLLMLPRDRVALVLAQLSARLADRFHLAVDVSDMRSLFRIENGREVLAKLSPVDLHPDSFAAGELRRTRLAQVSCAFWLEEDGFRLLCYRSVATYVEDLLRQAAADPVGAFRRP